MHLGLLNPRDSLGFAKKVHMTQSIYDKYGFEAISKIVHDFYGRVLKSDITAPYFEGHDMQRIIQHQTQFLCMLLGGPATYKGKELEMAHRNLSITPDAFGEVAELLDETLEDHGLTDEEREFVTNKVASTRPVIVAS